MVKLKSMQETITLKIEVVISHKEVSWFRCYQPHHGVPGALEYGIPNGRSRMPYPTFGHINNQRELSELRKAKRQIKLKK